MDAQGRGRPKLTALDYCPGLWWATELQERTGNPLKQVAKEAFDTAARSLDLGVFVQPEKLNQVQQGNVALNLRSRRHRQAIEAIEACYPGSSSPIYSITWDELRLASGRQPLQPITPARIHADLRSHISNELIHTQDALSLLLTKRGALHVGGLLHLDALGVLLMQRRLLSDQGGFAVHAAILGWLANALFELAPLRTHRIKILSAIEIALPILLPLIDDAGEPIIRSREEMQHRIFLEWLCWTHKACER